MSLDVRSYWQPAALTPMGLVQHAPDEIVLYATQSAHVDIECGGDGPKHTFVAGHAHVTSHRIVWVQDKAKAAQHGQPPAVALPLDSIAKAEVKSSLLSFGLATPKVVLHLHDPATLEYRRQQQAQAAAASAAAAAAAASSSAAAPAPARSMLPRYARLVFRNEPPTMFLQHLQSSLSAGVFRQPAAAPVVGAPAPRPTEFTTSRAGISGIEREARKRERAIDRTLEQAFSDLDALMQNAKTIVDLSARLAAQGARGEELKSDQSRSEFQSLLTDMGITNPVTRQMVGSNDYHVQLAKEMADFLPGVLEREGGGGGMLLLPDVYCLVNRARGTQLISPQDCLTACSLFEQLGGTSLRLREFPDTGVKVVVADAGTEGNVAARIKAMLVEEEAKAAAAVAGANTAMTGAAAVVSSSEVVAWTPSRPYVSLSSLRLSNLWHISIILARQYLCVAEQMQVLCRDEASHGLSFALNHFVEW